jgi:hypothetical protein
MALVLKDRVQETSNSFTTGSFTLAGAVTGYQAFSAIGNSNTTYYAATDTAGNWETGIGTYSTVGPALARTTILSSSNSGSAAAFTGTVNIFCTYVATKSVNLDASNLLSGTAISGGTINNTPIGGSTASSGAFTSVSMTSGTVSTAPSANTDIVNKLYADSIASGVNFHAACNYATTASLSAAYTYNNGSSGVGATITANAVGTLTIDGNTLSSSDVGKRILIKNETGAYTNNTTPSAAFNGVYTLTTAGTGSAAYVLTRATDYDTSGTGTNEIDVGDFLLVLSGTTNANTSWVQQTPLPITVGTTSIVFTQFGAASGGVSSFSAGSTGFTPSSATTGAITLGGQLAIGSGGTGTTSQISGLVKGGVSAFTAATAGTDYVAPGTATTFTAQQTFSGSATTIGMVLTDAAEVVTVSGTAATGTINFDVTTQSVLYYTTNASANWTVNFRASSGTSLNTAMATGQSVTVTFLVQQGSTAYYNNVVQVDGSAVTPKYQGGNAWTAGNASSIDAYTYTIVKTGSAAFTVFASQTRFA